LSQAGGGTFLLPPVLPPVESPHWARLPEDRRNRRNNLSRLAGVLPLPCDSWISIVVYPEAQRGNPTSNGWAYALRGMHVRVPLPLYQRTTRQNVTIYSIPRSRWRGCSVTPLLSHLESVPVFASDAPISRCTDVPIACAATKSTESHRLFNPAQPVAGLTSAL
jgi:hypothetical protein